MFRGKADVIALISAALTKRGCHVIQSSGDAAVDIVKATVERSHHCTTTLLGEDTDLLACSYIIPEQTIRSLISVLMQARS